MPICATCSKSYVRAEHLKRHREAAHPHEFRLEHGNQAPRRFHCDEPGCARVFSRSDVLVRHRRSHIKDEQQVDDTPSSSKRQRSSTSASTGSAPAGIETSLTADPAAAASTSTSTSTMMHHDNTNPTRRTSLDQMEGAMPSPSHRHMHSIQDLLSPSSSMTPSRPMEAVPPPPSMTHLHHQAQPQHQHQPPPMAAAAAAGPPPVPASMPFDAHHWHTHQPAAPAMPSEAAAPTNEYASPDIFGNAQQQMSSFDLFAGAGAAGGWSSNTLTGLDWIFDDQCDSASNTDASVISRFMTGFHGDDDHRAGDWQIFGPSPPVDRIGEMLGTAGRGHGTTTESINLLNLANAAASRTGDNAAQPHKPRSEEDGADAWPQEFRPQRSKPSIIEISDYSLDIEEQHHVNDLEAWLAAATATPRRGSPNGGSGGSGSDRPIVVIDEAGEATRANSRRASDSPNGSGLFGSTPSKWRVNEETRHQLLSYLQHSCRHPWSIYSFSKTPPTFLTCGQMELLISLCFRKFMAYCPILHPSSFEPSTAPPVLLLVTLAIGLVFYASEVQMHIGIRADRKDALSQLRKSAGVLSLAFSELVRIGVMSGYEADQTAWTNVELNQAWTIQQMFGIGSGDNRLYKLAERNRGGLITAIRRSGFFHTTDLRIDANALAEMSAAQLDKTWKAWIEAEKRVRLGWFVFLYDQLFACFLDIPPMLMFTEVSSPFPAEERLWNAADATEWARRYRASRGFVRSGSDRDSTPSSTSASSLSMPFLMTLRQLLSPQRQDAPQLRVNRLEAYILSVTLYRICWEAQKQSILFENDGGLEVDSKCLDNRLSGAASRALKYLADSASRATSVVKSRAPPPSSSDSHLSLALSIDVHLLSLLAKLHFTGPPALFQKLRDAAGRSGWYTPRRKDALAWLETWFSRPANQLAVKSMLVASAQVFDLIRSSLNSTVAKPDVLVIQSNICVISLFHASLYVWAYVKLSNSRRATGSGVDSNGRSGSNDPNSSAATRDPTSLPRLSPTKVSHVEASGFIDLVPNPYEALSAEGMDFAEPWEHHLSWEDDHEKLVTAWLQGAYVSGVDGEVREWAAASTLTPRVVGIGELIAPAQQRQHGGGGGGPSAPSTSAGAAGVGSAAATTTAILAAASRSVKASHVLQRFASLLRRLDWGLASTLSAILLLMARREAKSELAGRPAS